MVRTQIYLAKEQVERLRSLAARTGQRQSALIREAVDQLIAQVLRAFGAWADQDDSTEVTAANGCSLDDRRRRRS